MTMTVKQAQMANALRKEEAQKYARDDNDFRYMIDMLSGQQAGRDTARWGEEQGGFMEKLTSVAGKAPNPADPFGLFS